jgi:TIR domain-containing protein
MSDVFISYDSTDRTTAQNFADALESLGLSVWWDREIPFGKAFDLVIEEELNAARCVIVLWSKEAVHSRWVKTEAAAAADRECLIPVLIEDIEIPFEFRRIQTAMLKNWHGDPADPEFSLVIQAVRQLLKQPETAPPIIHSGMKAVSKLAQTWQTRRGLLVVFAVALIIMVGAIALRNPRQKAEPVPGSNDRVENPQPAGSSSTSASRSGTRNSLPRAFSIKIGDKIDDGVPAPGAGNIETPYSQDVYVFSAAPKQRVYFRQLRHGTAMSYIKWRLTDADGAEVFDTCLGCTEPGVQTLTKGGSYTLTVGNHKDPGTGIYQLQLFPVPAPTQFSIKIGDTIKESVPGAGAGVIESPGAEDVYAFTASPRQRVYFRAWEYSTGLAYIKWKLTDENGMEVFDTCLGCSEPGAQALIKGGSYTLTVGNQKDPSTGTYRLQLYNVPSPDRFSIKIGDKIKAGIPGTGAGVIEAPGAEDVYTFNAAPAQKVYFRLLEHGKGTEYINWRLVDDNGMELFNTCFGCTEPGAQTLTKGGSYTLTVGNPRNPATGNYVFELGAQ